MGYIFWEEVQQRGKNILFLNIFSVLVFYRTKTYLKILEGPYFHLTGLTWLIGLSAERWQQIQQEI